MILRDQMVEALYICDRIHFERNLGLPEQSKCNVKYIKKIQLQAQEKPPRFHLF